VKFKKELIGQVEEWVEDNGLMDFGGATLKEFCAHFGIDHRTYYRWLENTTFANALTRAREKFRDNIENRAARSLIKQVEGYRYTTKKTKAIYVNGGNNQPMIVKQDVTTYDVDVQPNTQATIFLLTKINPGKWGNAEVTRETPPLVVEVEDQETANLVNELMKGGDDEDD
jgi:hypothetical protein